MQARSLHPPVWRAFYEETGVPAAVSSGRALYVGGHIGGSADGIYPQTWKRR